MELAGRYAYRVRARNSHGLSPASDPFEADVPGLPATPQGLPGTVSHDAVTLPSWDDRQDGSIAGCQVLGWQIGVDGQGDFRVHAAGTAATRRAEQTAPPPGGHPVEPGPVPASAAMPGGITDRVKPQYQPSRANLDTGPVDYFSYCKPVRTGG